MPAARNVASAMTAPIASQTVPALTPRPNAGRSTRSVTRPSATVTAIDATANVNAPLTEIRNGLGCALMYEATSRMPRPNNPSASSRSWTSVLIRP